MTGAVWQEQLVCFLTVFAFGLAAGVAAVLLFRKSGVAETVLTDIFSLSVITGIYIAAIETANLGRTQPYVLAAFISGTVFSAYMLLKIKKLISPHLAPHVERTKTKLRNAVENSAAHRLKLKMSKSREARHLLRETTKTESKRYGNRHKEKPSNDKKQAERKKTGSFANETDKSITLKSAKERSSRASRAAKRNKRGFSELAPAKTNSRAFFARQGAIDKTNTRNL